MLVAPEPEDRELATIALPGDTQVRDAARQAVRGQRHGLAALIPFLGPAFVAAVAYVDPGNFATNISAGARYGYLLLWVVLVANLMAMLIQSMSARLGIATGLNLAEVCRARFPRPVVLALWAQAEVIAMATDLAEFVGAAVGLNLISGIPLFAAGLITGVAAFAVLSLQTRGFRMLEVLIAALVGVIVAAFSLEVFLARPDPGGIVRGLFTPRFAGTDSLVLAAGILGATVMPHVIYLHSALTQHRVIGRTPAEQRRIYQFERWDVILAMLVAGAVNLAMLIMAAATFHDQGGENPGDLEGAYRTLGVQLGRLAQLIFGIALLASGLSSAAVGTLAGQIVMQGFIRRRIPLLVRRTITMLPALAVLAVGVDPSQSLVLSQVILSFGIPFALIPLLMFCRNAEIMGGLVNRHATTIVATAVIGSIIALNVLLLAAALFPAS